MKREDVRCRSLKEYLKNKKVKAKRDWRSSMECLVLNLESLPLQKEGSG
jgi:hypothetical protein